jgi:hypothetical protein
MHANLHVARIFCINADLGDQILVRHDANQRLARLYYFPSRLWHNLLHQARGRSTDDDPVEPVGKFRDLPFGLSKLD